MWSQFFSSSVRFQKKISNFFCKVFCQLQLPLKFEFFIRLMITFLIKPYLMTPLTLLYISERVKHQLKHMDQLEITPGIRICNKKRSKMSGDVTWRRIIFTLFDDSSRGQSSYCLLHDVALFLLDLGKLIWTKTKNFNSRFNKFF